MTAYVPESHKPMDPERTGQGAGKAAPPQAPRGVLADYFAVTERRRSHRHYGRFVGIAKVLLLSLAAGLIAVLAIWPRLANKDTMMPIGASTDVQIEDIESLHVKNARLTGVSKDQRPYAVTFESASQTNNDSDLIVLTGPQADIELKSGAWLALSARKGRFHRAKRIIELDDPVHLYHDSGAEIATGSVTFNLTTGAGAGYDALKAQAPFGQLESQGFRIRDNSSVFVFDGPVRAVLYSTPSLE